MMYRLLQRLYKLTQHHKTHNILRFFERGMKRVSCVAYTTRHVQSQDKSCCKLPAGTRLLQPPLPQETGPRVIMQCWC